MKLINNLKRLLFQSKNSIKQDAAIHLFAGLILFLLLAIASHKTLLSGIIAGLAALIVFIFIGVQTHIGKKRYYTLIEGKGFQKLISIGFKAEEINNSRGLTGNYKGYIFDIYFDWSSIFNRAYFFNVYFEAPPYATIKANYEPVKSFSREYGRLRFSLKGYDYWWHGEGTLIMRNAVGIFTPSFEKLKMRMDMAVKLLKDENLKPIDEQTLLKFKNNKPSQA